jgi:RNA polymerase sigma factor (sigma-70 family)
VYPPGPQQPEQPAREDGEAGQPRSEDRAATVSRLFRDHNRTLIGFLFARLRNEQEAKEIAQEAYVKVLQLEQKPGAASFMRAYLFRVAEHLAVDRIRQRHTRERLEPLKTEEDLFEDDLAQRGAIAGQELALLTEMVGELPGKCAEAFRLHKLEDRSLLEVAQCMGLTERMVRKYVTRALVYIRLRREGISATEAWDEVKS